MEQQSFFKDLRAFIFSFKFLKHLIASLVIGFFLISMATFFLNMFTNHGESLAVPGFEGLTIEEAQELADDKGIRIEILDSVYAAPGKKGTIVDQNPPRDFKVKKNRTIFLTIKAFTPEMMVMPDFINSTLVQAKADLETYGLKVGKLKYEPWKYDNIVIKQLYKGKAIKAGELIEKGSYVDLVLGRTGEGGNTEVPMLIGLTREEAEQEISEKMLNVGSIVFDDSVIDEEDSLHAVVVKQNPGKNVSLVPGGKVDIWLSLKQETDEDNE